MNIETLARRYAMAYIKVAGAAFDEKELARVERLEKFLTTTKESLFFFNLSLIGPETEQEALDLLFKGFKTEKLFKKLMKLICNERRALLVPEMLRSIASLYREQHNIMLFSITTSHDVSDDDKKTINDFLAEKTGKTIGAEYAIDKTLIAGVRAQSDTLLWEQSIKKQLMAIRQSLVEQGVQWN
jgi:F-type H+-transporting ATPase subunit delta